MAEKLKYALYLCLFMPLACLPLKVLYLVSDFLCFIFRDCMHYRAKVVRENLRTSFPEKNESELREIERKFYAQLCDNIVETVKLLRVSRRTINKRLTVKDASLVDEAVASGRPVFLYLGHYCNWEWVPAITLHFTLPKVCAQIYKPLRDAAFDRLMLKVRSRFEALNIPQDRAMRTLIRLSREGSYVVGILDDHSPNHGRSHHYMEFLSHPGTIINVGAEEIGRRLNAVFLYLDVEKLGRGRYGFTFKPIIPSEKDEEYPYSHEYMRMLEATIRRQPPYWLWSHKRWRYTLANMQPTAAESSTATES